MITKNRIGVFGGTFNPIHLGHLILGEYIRENFQLDKVIYIPTGDPPHKDNCKIENKLHRYKMVELAIKNNDYFLLSDIEIHSEEKSYTINTIEKLKDVYGKSYEILFIIGADALLEIESWREFEKLLKTCSFVVAERLGASDTKLNDKVEDLKEKYGAKIFIANMPKIGISSSYIRKLIRHKKSIKYLVNNEVERYIYENKLYL